MVIMPIAIIAIVLRKGVDVMRHTSAGHPAADHLLTGSSAYALAIFRFGIAKHRCTIAWFTEQDANQFK